MALHVHVPLLAIWVFFFLFCLIEILLS
uniref:Uncharacterized protein n=1 Tax=Rhizophora mucronata TaxID=61149 RepID=A0A2P2PXI9_RHIMU